jgi:Nuclease-related domain
MELPPPLQWSWVMSALIGAAAIAVLLFVWRWYRRRRAQRALLVAMTAGAYEYLRNVLLPDGQGTPLHIDFLLLTARGIVVVDLRNIRGNVFGGDQMNEWTVMDGRIRYTFVNPQAALYDRQAAVRALANETPVEGRIVFGNNCRFPKGLPSFTRMLESMASDFPAIDRQAVSALPDGWQNEWRTIRDVSSPSSLVLPKAAV